MPEPESELPDPEDPEPELSSEPDGSSEPEAPPWSSTDGDGVGERWSSPFEVLGVGDLESDGRTVGWTTFPTSPPASASAPTVSATAAASPPIPSTTKPMTFFTHRA